MGMYTKGKEEGGRELVGQHARSAPGFNDYWLRVWPLFDIMPYKRGGES